VKLRGELFDLTDVEYTFVIDEQNAAHAQTYVDAIRRIPGEKMYEVAIDTSAVVGVEGQGGTGDAVTLDYENLTIHVDDLKFGMGEVVYADENEQCLEYGAGALWMFDMLADWKYVKLGIHMPRLRFYDERIYTVEEVRSWVEKTRPLEQEAHRLWERGTPEEIRAALSPSKKGCRWCPLSGNCVAQANQVRDMFTVSGPPKADTAVRLTDEQLNEARNTVEQLEAYCKAVKEEIHTRALQGATFADWEMVEGKQGNRAWSPATVLNKDDVELLGEDPITVEALLVKTVGEEAYEPRTVLSAAEADKLLNKKKHPEAEKRAAAWLELQRAITRAPAGKSLVKKGTPGKTPVTIQKLEFTVGSGE
jgi:hypothetical protein